MNLILWKNEYKSLIVILLTLNKLKKCWTSQEMLVILLSLGYWHKNVISYFGDFELLVDRLSFRWLLLTFLLFCKFHLKWISINWTFKVSPWLWTNKPSLLVTCCFIQLATVWIKLKLYILIHHFAVILLWL